MSHSQTRGEQEGLLMLRLSKVLSDPIRVRILAECSIEAMSPRSFRNEFGGPSLADVSQDFEVLEQFGWLGRMPAEAGAKPEKFDCLYSTTEPLIFDSDWSGISDSAKALVTWRIVETLSARVKDAIGAGTIDARPDSHLTWTPLALDQQGWETMIERVDALFYSLFEEQELANARLAESGEEPIPMTVGLLAFASPKRAA
jgi:hypothetical protein